MTDVTIKALASEIQTSVDRLIQQFADAGIRKSADDSVTCLLYTSPSPRDS